MQKIHYTEQFLAMIFACQGGLFALLGLLCFAGILAPSAGSMVQSQRGLGLVFSGVGGFLLAAAAVLAMVAGAKNRAYSALMADGRKVTATVEKVYPLRYLQWGKQSPYRVRYRYDAQGKCHHHKSRLLWKKPVLQEGDQITVCHSDSGKSAAVF